MTDTQRNATEAFDKATAEHEAKARELTIAYNAYMLALDASLAAQYAHRLAYIDYRDAVILAPTT